jgi:hypothetical protein
MANNVGYRATIDYRSTVPYGMTTGLSADVNVPTLTYPNGGESVFGRTIEVTWKRPAVASKDNSPVWYELFFTDEWEVNKEPEWVQVATVPSTAEKFVWTVPVGVRGDRCRFAIAARDQRGIRTPFSTSADNFTIQERNIASPAVFSPAENGSYHQFVPIVFDHKAVNDTYSQRAFYQVYYSSEANEKDWTLVRQNVPVGSEPFFWDIRELPPGKDYALKVVLADDRGNSSIPVYVRNLKLAPLDYFLLDTTPPKGKISVEGNNEYIKGRNIVLRLDAFDETTGVKSVTLRQTFGTAITSGTEQEMANVKTWYVSGEGDGVRCIESLFKDFGGNVPQVSEAGEFFRRYIYSENDPITCFLAVQSGSLITFYTTFGGSSPRLFEGKSSIATLAGEASCLGYFKGFLYVATKTSSNKGVLYKLESGSLTKIYEFVSLDSVITALAVFDDKLFVGLQNGDLYSFNGSAVTYIDSFESQIQSMFSEGNVLYVLVENEGDIQVYDGATFSAASITDGHLQV